MNTHKLTIGSIKSSRTLTQITTVRIKTSSPIQTRICKAFIYIHFTIIPRVSGMQTIASIIGNLIYANTPVLARIQLTLVEVHFALNASVTWGTNALRFRRVLVNLARSPVHANVRCTQRVDLDVFVTVLPGEPGRASAEEVAHEVFIAFGPVFANCRTPIARIAKVDLAVLARVSRGAVTRVRRVTVYASSVTHARFC